MTKNNLRVAATSFALGLMATSSAGAALTTTRHAQATHRTHVRNGAVAINNGGHQRQTFYGVGDAGQTPRTTATGGNAGGYSNKN